MKQSLPKLSASKIKLLKSCSWQFYCRYILKVPELSSNHGVLRGSIIHCVLECLLNKRRKSIVKIILANKDSYSYFPIKKLVQKHAHKVGIWSEENMEIMNKMILVALEHDFYHKGHIELHSEKNFSISRKGYFINGFIDKMALYPDGSAIVVDYKSSKARFAKEELAENLQALIYSLATWIEHKTIPIVKFLFLKFDKSPAQEAPRYTKDQLEGFEIQLQEITKYIKNFGEEKAFADFAAKDQSRKWMCGRNKFIGEKKEDGSDVWGCAYKFPFDYYIVDKDGQTLYSALTKEEITLKPGEKIKKMRYNGCPAFDNYSL